MHLCRGGQKASSVASVVRKLEEHGAMEHTIVVAANASDPAMHIWHLAGCTMGSTTVTGEKMR